MKILKSIGAVIAGVLTFAVLQIGTDIVMQVLVILPRAVRGEENATLMLAVSLVYRSIFTVAGGYITARLAPSKPMNHVVALMVLVVLGGLSGAILGWSLGNHWYHVLLNISGPVFVWLGGVWCVRRRAMMPM